MKKNHNNGLNMKPKECNASNSFDCLSNCNCVSCNNAHALASYEFSLPLRTLSGFFLNCSFHNCHNIIISGVIVQYVVISNLSYFSKINNLFKIIIFWLVAWRKLIIITQPAYSA